MQPDLTEFHSTSPTYQHQGGSEMRSKEDVSNARPPLGTTHQLPVYREMLMVFTICMSQLLTQAGLAQSIAPLHIIGSTFSVSTAQMTWFPASYSLTVGTFILFSGTLGDKYGHKRIFTIGWLWFALWSLVVGFSGFSGWSILFDTARAMQGIGPALLLPNALAILGQYYPPGAKKEMMFSLFGATAPGGFVLGAVFSSLLAQYVWWPWGYWILAIVCILLALLARLSLPPDHVVLASAPQQSFTKWSQVAPYLSIVCGLVGMILINIAWNQAPIQGWATPYICVLLACGVGLILLFTLLHLHQVRQTGSSGGFNTEVTVTLICVGLGWASFGIWIYYLWQIFQILRNASPLLSTAWFSPVALSGLTAALVTGRIIGRLYPAFIMMIAMAAFCIGSILAATMPIHQTYWTQTFISILIMPWGMDMSFPAGTIMISDAMPRDKQGMAGSLVNTVVNYSISLALGIAGTVERYSSDIESSDPEVLLQGYRHALYLAVGLSGMGCVLATSFVVNKSWRGTQPTPS